MNCIKKYKRLEKDFFPLFQVFSSQCCRQAQSKGFYCKHTFQHHFLRITTLISRRENKSEFIRGHEVKWCSSELTAISLLFFLSVEGTFFPRSGVRLMLLLLI